jgi:hypothetical protein
VVSVHILSSCLNYSFAFKCHAFAAILLMDIRVARLAVTATVPANSVTLSIMYSPS